MLRRLSPEMVFTDVPEPVSPQTPEGAQVLNVLITRPAAPEPTKQERPIAQRSRHVPWDNALNTGKGR
jgi:hypothetical protein